MTLNEVILLIQTWIVENGNEEITADVLRPILEAMVNQPNALIGDLDNLTTTDKDDLVEAINEVRSLAITNAGLVIHSGSGTPEETPPVSVGLGDFYAQVIFPSTSVVSFWQYNGSVWVEQRQQRTRTVLKFVSLVGVDTTGKSQVQWMAEAINLNISNGAVYECEPGDIIDFFINIIDETSGGAPTVRRIFTRLMTGATSVTSVTEFDLMPDGSEDVFIDSDLIVELGDIGTDDVWDAFNADPNQPFEMDNEMFVSAIQNSENKLWQWVGGTGTFGSTATPSVEADFLDLTEQPPITTYQLFRKYDDIAAMLADQSTQIAQQGILVLDATDDPNITFPSGLDAELKYAYYQKKAGSTTGTISDYRLISAPYGLISGGAIEADIIALQEGKTDKGGYEGTAQDLKNEVNLIPKNKISSKVFGLVGDNTTDDSAALQTASDFCEANKLTLELERDKIYLCNLPVTLRCDIDGRFAQINVNMVTTNSFRVNAENLNIKRLRIFSTSNQSIIVYKDNNTFENCTFESDNEQDLFWNRANHTTLYKCKLKLSTKKRFRAIYSDQSKSNLKVINSEITGGIHIVNFYSVAGSAGNNEISGCDINVDFSDAVQDTLTGHDAFALYGIQGMKMFNNTIKVKNVNRCFKISDRNGAPTSPVSIYTSNGIEIYDNYIESDSVNGKQMFDMFRGTANITIRNNEIHAINHVHVFENKTEDVMSIDGCAKVFGNKIYFDFILCKFYGDGLLTDTDRRQGAIFSNNECIYTGSSLPDTRDIMEGGVLTPVSFGGALAFKGLHYAHVKDNVFTAETVTDAFLKEKDWVNTLDVKEFVMTNNSGSGRITAINTLATKNFDVSNNKFYEVTAPKSIIYIDSPINIETVNIKNNTVDKITTNVVRFMELANLYATNFNIIGNTHKGRNLMFTTSGTKNVTFQNFDFMPAYQEKLSITKTIASGAIEDITTIATPAYDAYHEVIMEFSNQQYFKNNSLEIYAVLDAPGTTYTVKVKNNGAGSHDMTAVPVIATQKARGIIINS